LTVNGAGLFGKHRVAQVIRYGEKGALRKAFPFLKSLYFFERTNEKQIISILFF